MVAMLSDDWNLAELDAAAKERKELREFDVEVRAAAAEQRGGVLVRTAGGAILRYQPGQVEPVRRRYAPDLNEPRPGVFVRRTPVEDVPATEKQVAFLSSLLQRKLPTLPAATILTAGAASKLVCSEMIDELLKADDAAPAVARPAQTFSPVGAPAFPEVPEGRYAVQREGGPLRFYSVDRPTEGRWAGFTFLAVWASDETFPIRDRETKREILAEIALDPEAAMLRFGREIGKCGHCGRTLTDASSRAAGIGPVCAGRVAF